AVIRTPHLDRIGYKAGPIARRMLRGRKTKHWMRMIYSLRSLWSLKKSVKSSYSSKDFLQAGKSVAGVERIEPAGEIVRRCAASAAAAQTRDVAAAG
ncbi:MAG: nitronate monooxygenase, partial [Acidobacteriota bacterium]